MFHVEPLIISPFRVVARFVSGLLRLALDAVARLRGIDYTDCPTWTAQPSHTAGSDSLKFYHASQLR